MINLYVITTLFLGESSMSLYSVMHGLPNLLRRKLLQKVVLQSWSFSSIEQHFQRSISFKGDKTFQIHVKHKMFCSSKVKSAYQEP